MPPIARRGLSLRETFELIDADGSGEIDRREAQRQAAKLVLDRDVADGRHAAQVVQQVKTLRKQVLVGIVIKINDIENIPKFDLEGDF